MNVKAVFARVEILTVGDHLDLIANFGECDYAAYLTS